MRILKNWSDMTQDQRIAVALLREQGGVQPLMAWSEYGTYRLGAVIFRLRHDWGVSIDMERKEVTGRFGGTANVGNYTPSSYQDAVVLYSRLYREGVTQQGLPEFWMYVKGSAA